jgi:methionine-rich copper-binding protein CopC
MTERRRGIACILTAAILLALTAGLAAHLAVAKTLPADKATLSEPPTRIQVWFTQQPSPRVSRLDLRGPGGDVPLGELQFDREARSMAAPVEETLPPGSYEFTWRTAGDDGHVQRGTIAFVIRARS